MKGTIKAKGMKYGKAILFEGNEKFNKLDPMIEQQFDFLNVGDIVDYELGEKKKITKISKVEQKPLIYVRNPPETERIKNFVKVDNSFKVKEFETINPSAYSDYFKVYMSLLVDEFAEINKLAIVKGIIDTRQQTTLFLSVKDQLKELRNLEIEKRLRK